jgi:uncharacterized protein (TIGR01777 family)
MATILITGGTGMIGRALTRTLIEKDYKVIILTRKTPDAQYGNKVAYAEWDIRKQTIAPEAISSADHIIHLAGANVGDKRWTDKRKKEIVDSRVKSGELLVKALKEIPNKVKTVITSSGIGWYGPDPVVPNPRPFKENDPHYHDFLGETCKEWEGSLDPVTTIGKRLIKFRTGIVLSHKGGALKEFEKPLRFRFATILGSGKQVTSWIQIDDLAQLYIYAIEKEHINGVYNAVSPHPVTNKELIFALARAKKGGFYIPFPVPAFMLKLVLGEMSIEVLKSATVSADKIQKEGFSFQYPDLKNLHSWFRGK